MRRGQFKTRGGPCKARGGEWEARGVRRDKSGWGQELSAGAGGRKGSVGLCRRWSVNRGCDRSTGVVRGQQGL